MENLFFAIIFSISIIGWYILLKEITWHLLYKNIEIDEDIKCQIIVQNKQENIEVILRKILYMQNKMIGFKNIEIIDNKSNDETYEILEKMQDEYPNIKLRKIL